MIHRSVFIKPVDIYEVHSLSHLIYYYSRDKDDIEKVKKYLRLLELEDPNYSMSITKDAIQWAKLWIYCKNHRLKLQTHKVQRLSP